MAIVGEGLVVIRAASTAFEGDLAGAASKMVKVLTVAGAAAAAGAIAGIATIGMAYEQTLNTFQAVSSANAEQMGRVAAAAKALGNDMSLPATSAADAAKAMTELAKAGLSVDQSLAAAKGTLQLSAAAEVDAAKAAEITANALNMFNLSGDRAGYVADVLANSANASSAEITDMADALKMAGAVMNSAGVSIADTAAMLGVLANNGMKGSDAGTSLKQMFLSLEAPSKPARAALADLGIKVYDAAGKMNSARDIIGQFSGSLGKLTQQQRDHALSAIFGSDAVRAANIIFGEGVTAFDDMKAAVERSGGAADVAAAKTKGLRGAWEGLKSQLETVAISIYEKASPAVESFVRSIANGIPQAQKAIGGMVDAFVGGFQNPDALIGPSVSRWQALFLQVGATFHDVWSGMQEGLVDDDIGHQIGNAIRVIGETARDFLPTVKDMLGDIIDAAGGLLAVAKPILDTLFTLFVPAAGAAVAVVVGLVDGLGALGRWLSDNNGAVQVIAGIITAVLIPALVSIGVTATISAAQSVLAWVAMEARAIAGAVAHGIQVAIIVGGWILMGVTAMAQAAVVAAAWLISLGPIALVVAAVIGLAAVIVANWDTIKEAVGAGAEWVRGHMDVVITALVAVTGPLGLLVALFVSSWDSIKGVVAEGVRVVVDHFLGMAEMVTGLAAKAFGWIPGVGPELRHAADAVANFRDDVNAYLDSIHDKTITITVNHLEYHYSDLDSGPHHDDLSHSDGFATGGVIGGYAIPRAARGMRTRGPTLVGEGNQNFPEYVIPTDPQYRKRALGLMASLGNELGVSPSAAASPDLMRAVQLLTEAVDRLAAMNTGGVHVHGVDDPFTAARVALDELQWRSGVAA